MPSVNRFLLWSFILFATAAIISLSFAGFWFFKTSAKLPDVHSLRSFELKEPMYVYAQDQQLIAVYGEARRYPVKITKVPELLKQAFIALEDNNFYKHNGIDYKGIARAIWLLITTDGKRVPGGSTITQQVARQFYLSHEYSYSRKFTEMLLAMRVEKQFSKDEIFELYLNKSFFGNRAYGIRAASEFYYGKTLDQLDLNEMAMLASIPKFPSTGNPISNPERARVRRDYALTRMRELGFISPEQEKMAQVVPVHTVPHEPPVQVEAPYIAEMVRQKMIEQFGDDALTQGYRVTTTIQSDLQTTANDSIRDGLTVYNHRQGWREAEQHFELSKDELAISAAKHLQGIATQNGFIPVLVLNHYEKRIDVVLHNGNTLTMDVDDQQWNNRYPSKHIKRGDVIRIRRIDVDANIVDGSGSESPISSIATTQPQYQIEQLPSAQAALVSLNVNTGALLSLVGGFSYSGSKFNRAIQMHRQPGSSFKPLLYAAAMAYGLNPGSVILDAPIELNDQVDHIWRPQNDSGDFVGLIRLRKALAQSRNLVSVRLLDMIGVVYARKYITLFGIDEELLPHNLSLALGSASLSPILMAQAYATFSNGGFRITPYFIDQIHDRNGKLIFQSNPAVACRACSQESSTRPSKLEHSEIIAGFNFGSNNQEHHADQAQVASAPGEDQKPFVEHAAVPVQEQVLKSFPIEDTPLAPRVIDAATVYQIVSMMRSVVQYGTASAARILDREDLAGKTGSTNDYRDAWFSGYAGNIATTAWIGRDDYLSLGDREYASKVTLPVWINYMRTALANQPIADNNPPANMVKVTMGIHGQLLAANTENSVTEWVRRTDLSRLRTEAKEAVKKNKDDAMAFDIF